MTNYLTDPTIITQTSFTIIEAELTAAGYAFEPPLAGLIQRIIHSTADFDFAKITHLSLGAIEAGVQALQAGCAIVTDVNMVKVGINANRVVQLGGSLHCFVADAQIAARAKQDQTTRSAMALRWAAEAGLLEQGLAVIGNAPTALYEVLQLINEGIQPALIIGVPVGFVSTPESKAALMTLTTIPWITTEGRKGGSPVAVAIVNALLRLAQGGKATD